jgi:acyl-ACP thioesterase
MHLKYLRLNTDDLEKYGMVWVLISSSFEIIRPICAPIRVLGHTWNSENSKFTFRREFTFTDEAGETLFNAATFSVLMDINARKILRPVNLPFDLSEPNASFTMEASSKIRNRATMTPCDSRKIYPSHIDGIGHTNNCHYSEFVYDAFTQSEIENLPNLRRMDLYFMSELRLGDSFTVRRGIDDNGALIIDGINESSDKESFAGKIIFK